MFSRIFPSAEYSQNNQRNNNLQTRDYSLDTYFAGSQSFAWVRALYNAACAQYLTSRQAYLFTTRLA